MAAILLSTIAAGSGGFVITGECQGSRSGFSVASAGDVNGDGFDDLIVGAPKWSSEVITTPGPYGSYTSYSNEGRSYVVFGGSANPGPINLSAIAAGSGGFAIIDDNPNHYGQIGRSVASAGDINGDGLADLIVGSYNGKYSYVVFGKTDGSAVAVSAVEAGSGGFAIKGEPTFFGAWPSRSVSSAGDVNGDGLADLILGSDAQNAAGYNAGRSYVVFGQTGNAMVQLSAVAAGNGGFALTAEAAGDFSGYSVAGAGDVNGDGLADVIVGARLNDANGNNNSGRSYVVFGRTDTSGGINLATLAATSSGFAISGEAASNTSGSSVASAGDVNGDGLADLIVGAPNMGVNQAGRSYVIFGQTGAVDINLATVAGGSGGFMMNGSTNGGFSGGTVAGAGDINGDGLADLIIGARTASLSYVVFGKTSMGAIELTAVAGGSGGFTISTEASNDWAGRGVAAGGDINGDGLADLIVGAYGNDAGGNYAGRSYVIFGSTSGTYYPTAVDVMGTSGNDTLSGSAAHETIVAGAGNDTLIGNGVDVLYGGTGDDRFELGSANFNYLSSSFGTYQGNKARVVGDGGIDTLAIVGAGVTADLTAIANQGAASPAVTSSIESIERIDLTGSGSNTVVIGAADVIDMAGMNSFNAGNGWTGLGAVVAKHQVVVVGNAGDKVSLADPANWTQAGTASYLSTSYAIWNHNTSAAQLLVASSVLVKDLADVVSNGGGFIINGESSGDRAGFSVASAGDVNGDGLADLIVGARDHDTGGTSVGRSYVVFGQSGGAAVDLSAVASGSGGGFAITGESAYDYSGNSVAGIGDINGDGLVDLLIGAPGKNGSGSAGRSYVVFGKADGAAISLSALGSGGFAIHGECANDNAGFSVAAAGDVNGDGLADMIVGARLNDGAGNYAGRSYVVFGQTAMGAVNLSAVATGSGGFAITGQTTADQSGFSVAGAGDVNGDGLADLIVGSPGNNGSTGRSYVVFGRSDNPTNIDLSTLGSGGFAITGQAVNDNSGKAVAAAGDVNGDGLADLIVAAEGNDAGGGNAGRAYVVFGTTATTAINLSAVAIGNGGFAITGETAQDGVARNIAAAGDVNGDGLSDLIVGVYRNDAGGNEAGRTYVVFGQSAGTPVSLSAVAAGNGGFAITGGTTYGASGYSVAAAGDVNGDGLADLIASDKDGAGHSYVIFGATNGIFAQTAVDQPGTTGNDTLTGGSGGVSETLVAGAGDDTLIGNGGADVLHGGAGNDLFQLDASNVANLSTGVTDGNLARVDGGSGIDTLATVGAGVTVDLRAIANQGGATPSSASRIESIERIDLTGSGKNSVVISAADVVDMAGMNTFNSSNGWTALGPTVSRHQLVVDGNDGDAVYFSDAGNWTQAGTVTNSLITYSVFNHNSVAAQVLVPQALLPWVDLSSIAAGSGGFVINGGACTGERSGVSVASAGDVNGDGLGDLIVGAFFNGQTGPASGRSYVVFGTTSNSPIDLTTVAGGIGGFAINAEAAGDWSGFSVAGGGDFNGDGLADLIVGSHRNDGGGTDAGRSYVVFGQTGGAAINLAAVATGSGGFAITGEASNDFSGFSVSSAGDVNGDGRVDLIVGVPTSGAGAGSSYVVFGTTGAPASINLADIAAGNGGFAIAGESAGDTSGRRVSAAGDVNGDGLGDLIVGADYNGGTDAGRSYVVFGQTGGTAINLSALGSGGFTITGESANDRSGYSVAAAGDVNGDGLADLVVGARLNDAGGSDAGRSYVVFGTTGTAPVSLATVATGSGGFAITGQAGELSGWSVAAAGDVNGDGLADLIIGAKGSDVSGTDSGRSYVVFGQTGGTEVNLGAVAGGIGGFAINAEDAGNESGQSVVAAGDVNGDGLADLIVGSPLNNYGAGSSYVIFGSTGGAFAQSKVDQLGTAGANVISGGYDAYSYSALSETLIAGDGNDTIYGNGGSDVIFGGRGNDVFQLNADNVAQLGMGVTGGNLARVDGGSGIDTLAIVGAGVTVNLGAIANQGGAMPSSASRIESVERIDLSGNGNNSLTLGVQDVIDMAGMNSFNSNNNWAGLGTNVARHQLVVDGNAGDTVNFSDATNWTKSGIATNNGTSYAVFNHNTAAAQVMVEVDLIPRIDLSDIADGNGGFVINGASAGDWSGRSVSAAGDVNGDGLGDVIVGAPGEWPDGMFVRGTGRSYVVFGKGDNSAVNLAGVSAGSGGFAINGESADDWAGLSVSAAGDVNGDGFADLIVGAQYSGASNSGRSYVVFGKNDGTTVDLSAVANGTGGFAITGGVPDGRSGGSVAAAGDVNGDGFADLVIGEPVGPGWLGKSYVVFGHSVNAPVDLTNLGGNGFVINPDNLPDGAFAGNSVSSAGDVNGDGLGDLVIGAPGISGDTGHSYVVFGKSDAGAINLSDIASGTGGFVIHGESGSDASGTSVAAAGDVNGDGLSDLIVGAPKSGTTDSGRSYVVFGQTGGTAINLTAVAAGSGGFAINGEADYQYSGQSVAGAGDVNGDGLADLIIGARGNDAGGMDAGRSYVVFGQAGGTVINLTAVAAGSGGFAITGQNAADQSGFSVAGAGDINGDGLADLIVGAPYSDPAAGTDAGRSYVIFGSTSGAFAQTAVDQLGTFDNDILGGGFNGETLVAGTGDDILIGGGGNDVLYGGAGNDVFVLNADNIVYLALAADGGSGELARVDGGSGIDTLVIDDAGVKLNLTAIANQGAAGPSSASRIESIERIDLSGNGNNSVTIGVQDVVDIAGMNSFNAGNGWTGLDSQVARHQLVVDGNGGDVVKLTDADNWTQAATANLSGTDYAIYNHNSVAAQVLVATTVAVNPPIIELVDIASGIGGFAITGGDGGEGGNLSGFSVAGAGDVNGDGLADLIVGAPNVGFGAGRSYVVFGQTDLTEILLSDVANGNGGFAITGETNNDRSGSSVAAAGDVNGDGLADLIVGAPNVAYSSGRSYVVFGQTGGTAINLADVASSNGGFAITGENNSDRSGLSVAAAGDVNGDGLADLIVGAPRADDYYTGRSYVVFGSTGAASEILLSDVAGGSGGFVIIGGDGGEGDMSGFSVAGAGDVNGDGFGDLIVGAQYNQAGDYQAGRSYVVFGTAEPAAQVYLSAVAIGSGGFAITGTYGDNSGRSVASVGDINGDGFADLVIGAPYYSSYSSGRSFVVFGSANPAADISLSDVATGAGGFVINGEASGDRSGFSVASAGDINGDGLGDLIVGAYYNDAGGYNAGRSYVVFGTADTTPIDLSAVAAGSGGFVITGESNDDYSGFSVASAGDVNGDGLGDLIVGAYGHDTGGYYGSNAGRSYVIFGSTSGAFAQTAVDQIGSAGSDTLTGGTESETLVAGSGDDTLIGNGGADVLHGGAGNDLFQLAADNIAKLGAGVTAGNLARVDGGSGIDTLAIVGAGVTVDLTTVANQGGASPSSASRIESIERIDLTGSGNNSLTIGAADVIDMAGMNSFNNANAWEDGTYNLAAGGTNGANAEQRHQVVVDGNSGDGVTLTGSASWTLVGTVTNSGDTYNVFNHAAASAQVLVDVAVANVNVALTGTANADTLLGLAGNDTLDGGTGSDWLQGDAGTDTLILTPDGVWSSAHVGFNEGSPSTSGTGQKVSLVGKNRFSDVLDGGSDADTLQLTEGNDAYFLHDAFSGFTAGVALGTDVRGQASAARGLSIEQILGGGGNDLIDLTSANYSIAGVTVDGGSGNDILWGNAGNDTLQGGGDNDILFGGAGNDFLTGGSGADVFQFVQSGGGSDQISDFNTAEDTLRLFGATSLSELTSEVSGSDRVLTWNGQTITLQGVIDVPSTGWIVLG